MRRVLLVSIILQFIFFRLFAQVNDIKFDRILPKDGLSHGTVTSIMQDREGYIWFGTGDGLNRFDGYNFEVYEHDPYNANSISNNYIRAICEDRSGMLWIGTSRCLNKYDKSTGTFTTYEHKPGDKQSISDNDILSVYEDRSGILWVGTKLGLNRYDKHTNTFKLFEHTPKHPLAWENNSIHTIYEDRSGILWVGTTQGVSSFNQDTGTFTRLNHFSQAADSLAYVTSILEDRSGILWIGTMGDGLKQFDRTTNSIKTYKHDPDDISSISSNRIFSLLEDSFGIIWIGNQQTGLDRFDKSTGKFTHYKYNINNSNTLSDNTVFSLHEDRSKVLWIGTFTGGVNKVDLLRKKITHYQHNPGNAASLSHNFVFSIYQDHDGAVWVGNPTGLNKLDKETDTFIHHTYAPKLPDNLSYNTAHAIIEDKTANLWVGLRGYGLKRFNRKTQKVISYKNNPGDTTSLPNNFVFTVYEDKAGNLWIGTRGGLSRFNPGRETFTTYKPGAHRFDVELILEDKAGVLWLATPSDGLVKFDPKKNVFTQYPIKNLSATSNKAISYIHADKNGLIWVSLQVGGLYTFDPITFTYTPVSAPKELSKILINGILEDGKGNLWLSTRKSGIYKFNPTAKSLHNYDVYDGLQSNEFNRALYKGASGEMYFGGNNGFNVFHPDSLQDNPYAPQVAITNFKVFDKPRHFFNNEVKLDYSDNFFSFDFVALSFSLPDKNKYAYKLENFNEDWVEAGSRRYAAYTNLDPGEYVFKVKAANHDGVWNTQGASLKIMIMPPWWKTGWAYFAYSILFVGFIYGFRQYTINREQLKNKLKLKSLESEKLQELDQMRSKFFTNISHEFRTPLTLIISPLEKILSRNLPESQKSEFSLMYRNANRLLQLINQLMDMSKLEAGGMKLETSPGDIMPFIKAHVFAFVSLAESHGIKLDFYHQPETLWVQFDRDKLEKIINNLISNAFKFTPKNGEIAVTVNLKPVPGQTNAVRVIELQVKDSGIGIAQNMRDKIFDRFYQIDSSYTHEFEGTGIGLSLTKELVELHGGTISVVSEEGKGACFIVTLPLLTVPEIDVRSDDSTEVFLESENHKFKHVSGYSLDETENLLNDPAAQNFSGDEEVPLLLIVEDNADVRTYIGSIFNNMYRVIAAKDGKEGLQMAKEYIPDLIISDWMMPYMNGVELCYQLKTDERTSHIPIILLTAKATVESKLQGLETGADDYLIKPFHTDELITRAKNLIAGRRRLRERFSRELAIPSSTPADPLADPEATAAINTVDEKFLQKLMEMIDANLSDADLSIEFIEREVGMSHGQLYRKVKALTDQSPGEFLRSYRLKKAAQFLSRKEGNVSQVAYMVGFNNLSYFTKCFRQMYGSTPSEYAAASSKINF